MAINLSALFDGAVKHNASDIHLSEGSVPYIRIDGTLHPIKGDRFSKADMETLLDKIGFSREEIIGRDLFDLYHPESHDRLKALFAQFVTTGEIRDEEMKVTCRDGSALDVSVSVSAVRDAGGRIIRSRAIWRDITDRKQAEAELLRAKHPRNLLRDLAADVCRRFDCRLVGNEGKVAALRLHARAAPR